MVISGVPPDSPRVLNVGPGPEHHVGHRQRDAEPGEQRGEHGGDEQGAGAGRHARSVRSGPGRGPGRTAAEPEPGSGGEEAEPAGARRVGDGDRLGRDLDGLGRPRPPARPGVVASPCPSGCAPSAEPAESSAARDSSRVCSAAGARRAAGQLDAVVRAEGQRDLGQAVHAHLGDTLDVAQVLDQRDGVAERGAPGGTRACRPGRGRRRRARRRCPREAPRCAHGPAAVSWAPPGGGTRVIGTPQRRVLRRWAGQRRAGRQRRARAAASRSSRPGCGPSRAG